MELKEIFGKDMVPEAFGQVADDCGECEKDQGLTVTIVVDEDVTVEIEDSGPGMTKSTMKNIFEPLFTTKETGTGLGLSICKSIVEQHGGSIEVSSPPTVFTITLPKNLLGYYKAK